jgi:hypothetical protein
MGTGAVPDRGSLLTRVSSGFGGVGGIMFVTGGCGVSRTGTSVRAESTGGDVSSPSRNLLGRLGEEDEANQARFLGTNFV